MSDTDKPEQPRVYGQADDGSRTPAAPGGMAGEASAPLDPDATSPEQVREIDLDGSEVPVQETSGVAFAEWAGRAGLARDNDANDRD